MDFCSIFGQKLLRNFGCHISSMYVYETFYSAHCQEKHLLCASWGSGTKGPGSELCEVGKTAETEEFWMFWDELLGIPSLSSNITGWHCDMKTDAGCNVWPESSCGIAGICLCRAAGAAADLSGLWNLHSRAFTFVIEKLSHWHYRAICDGKSEDAPLAAAELSANYQSTSVVHLWTPWVSRIFFWIFLNFSDFSDFSWFFLIFLYFVNFWDSRATCAHHRCLAPFLQQVSIEHMLPWQWGGPSWWAALTNSGPLHCQGHKFSNGPEFTAVCINDGSWSRVLFNYKILDLEKFMLLLSPMFWKISRDVKIAVLYERELLDLDDILDCCGFSELTWYRVLKLRRETGDVVNPKTSLQGWRRNLDQDDVIYLIQLITLTILLMSCWISSVQIVFISVNIATIHRELESVELQQSETSPDELSSLHKWHNSPGELGFIDKVSKDERTLGRHYGRSTRGKHAPKKQPFVQGCHTSLDVSSSLGLLRRRDTLFTGARGMWMYSMRMVEIFLSPKFCNWTKTPLQLPSFMQTAVRSLFIFLHESVLLIC